MPGPMAAFVSAATSGPFSTSLDGFQAIKDSLKPERSRTFELGWRFNLGRVQGVLAGWIAPPALLAEFS